MRDLDRSYYYFCCNVKNLALFSGKIAKVASFSEATYIMLSI
jgi:hypothetical protein